MEVRVAAAAQDMLGEGPVWDPHAKRLLRVDVLKGVVYEVTPDGRSIILNEREGTVSAVVPCSSGGLIVAANHDLIAIAPDGRESVIASTEVDNDDTRLNDSRVDPQGRLWVGSMSPTRTPGQGALYRLTPAEPIATVFTGVSISNGIGWSPAGDRMYFIDSLEYRVDVLDFDGRDGTVSGRRTLAAIDPEAGLPDGLAVDVEGGVWVALFGGGSLHRYDADGKLDLDLELPVRNPTCPAFGGDGLETLYVTTGRIRMTAEEIAAEPLAGSVLELTPGVAGVPLPAYAG